MKSLRLMIPLIIFLALCVLFYLMLDRDTQRLPSPLIGQPVPEFILPMLPALEASPSIKSQENQTSTQANLNQQIFQGQKRILNIWASWCAACLVEHPLFNQIKQNTDWPIIGLNYKDQLLDAQQWLIRMQDPYQTIIYDPEGSLGLDLGVYGVPETFLIDEQGIIQYKHVGPICSTIIEQVFAPFFQGQAINMKAECKDNA